MPPAAPAIISPREPEVSAERPWLGLKAFTEETQQYFFGREAEVREIYLRVREHPLTVLFGQSGLGKSSLLGAGLVPKLKVEGLRSVIVRLRHQPGEAPLLEQLRNATAEACSTTAEEAAALLERWRDVPSLWEILHGTKWKPDGLASRIPVVVLDQFEEIFTLGQSSSRRGQTLQFMEQLADLVENRPPQPLQNRLREERRLARDYDFAASPLRIVLTLREDYLSHLEGWKKSIPSLMRNRMALQALSGPQALEAVVKPGRLGAAELVSEEVGARIVCFVAKRPPGTPLEEIKAVPPLLSLLCDELNEQRIRQKGERITAEQVSGQSADILQQFYDQSFAHLPPGVRQFVEDRLVTVGGHRTAVAREDAEAALTKLGVAAPGLAMDHLVSGRLLGVEERSGIQVLELSHDILASLAKSSRDLRQEREQREAAEAVLEKNRRERSRLRKIAIGAAALALAAVAGAIFGFVAMRRAQASAQEAQTARSRAAAALESAVANENLANAEKDKGVKLLQQASLQSLAYAEKEVANGFVTTAFAYLAQALRYDPRNTRAIAAAHSLIAQGTGQAAMVPFSDVTVPPDYQVGHFSPNGERLLAMTLADAASRATGQLVDTASGAVVGSAITGLQTFDQPSFSADGSLLAVRRWNAKGGIQVEVFSASDGRSRLLLGGAEGQITFAQVSADGSRILGRDASGKVAVWDSAGALLSEFSITATDSVLAISPDGTTAAISALAPMKIENPNPGTIILGQAPSPAQRVRLVSLKDGSTIGEDLPGARFLADVRFSPNGAWLVIGGTEEGKIAVCDARTGRIAASVTAEKSGRVLFSPDNSWFATYQEYGSSAAEFHHLPSGQKIGKNLSLQHILSGVRVSPDGLTAFAMSSGGQGYSGYGWLWDTAGQRYRRTVIQHGGGIWDAVFSKDGRWLLTWGQDRRICRWSLGSTTAVPLVLPTGSSVNAVAFSPDSGIVAAGAASGLVGMWDRATGRRHAAPLLHAGVVTALEFSPDGNLLATGSDDRTARFWNAATGTPAGPPMVHNYRVSRLRFMQGGVLCLLTLSEDVRSWDLGGKALGRRSHAALEAAVADRFRYSEGIRTAPTNPLPAASLGISAALPFAVIGGTGMTTHLVQPPSLGAVDKTLPMVSFFEAFGAMGNFEISPTGQWVASLGFDRPELVETRDGTRRPVLLQGFTPRVLSLSSRGEQVLLGGKGTQGDGCLVVAAQDLKRVGFGLPVQMELTAAALSPDGAWIASGGTEKAVRVWEAVQAESESPPWLPEFLELLATSYAGTDGTLTFLPFESQLERRNRLREMLPAESSSARIGAWWLANPFSRPISPNAKVSTADHARQLAASGSILKSKEDVLRAADLDPGCPILHIALAAFETDPQRRAFLREFDIVRIPADPEIRQLAASLLIVQQDMDGARRIFQAGGGSAPDDAELLKPAVALLAGQATAELMLAQVRAGDASLDAGKTEDAAAAYGSAYAIGAAGGGKQDACRGLLLAGLAAVESQRGNSTAAAAQFEAARPLIDLYFPPETSAGAALEIRRAAFLAKSGDAAAAERILRSALAVFAKTGDGFSAMRPDTWQLLRDCWDKQGVAQADADARAAALRGELQRELDRTPGALSQLEQAGWNKLGAGDAAGALADYGKFQQVIESQLETEADPMERAALAESLMAAWRGRIAAAARAGKLDEAKTQLAAAEAFLTKRGAEFWQTRGQRRQSFGLLNMREEVARPTSGAAGVAAVRREMVAMARKWRTEAGTTDEQKTAEFATGAFSSHLSHALVQNREFAEALAMAREGAAKNPGLDAELALVVALIFENRWDEARALCEKNKMAWMNSTASHWPKQLLDTLSYCWRLNVQHPDMARAAAFFNWSWPPAAGP